MAAGVEEYGNVAKKPTRMVLDLTAELGRRVAQRHEELVPDRPTQENRPSLSPSAISMGPATPLPPDDRPPDVEKESGSDLVLPRTRPKRSATSYGLGHGPAMELPPRPKSFIS